MLRFHDVIAVSLFEFFRKTCRHILKYWCNGIRVWVYFHLLLDSQTIPLNLYIFFKLCPSPKNLFTFFFIFQSLIYSTWFTVFTAVVQLLSHVQLFMTPWTAAHQASLSLTISQSSPNSRPSNRWCRPTIPSAVTVLSLTQSFRAPQTLLGKVWKDQVEDPLCVMIQFFGRIADLLYIGNTWIS